MPDDDYWADIDALYFFSIACCSFTYDFDSNALAEELYIYSDEYTDDNIVKPSRDVMQRFLVKSYYESLLPHFGIDDPDNFSFDSDVTVYHGDDCSDYETVHVEDRI